MCEREDRPAIPRVVHEDVRMHAGHVGGAIGAVALVRPDRSVDPVVVEEPLERRACLAGELAVGLDHDLLRFVPRRLRRVLGNRREAVVVLEPVEAEQLRLEPVIALRHVVPGCCSVDERLHRGVSCFVAEVASRDPGGVATQPVVDRLVLQNRVEDGRPRAEAGLEGGTNRLRRAATLVAVGRVELCHRSLERNGLVAAREVDAEGAKHFLIESRPRGDARDGLLGDDLLLRLRQEVGPEDALR